MLRRTTVTILAITLLFVIACGGGDDSSSPTPGVSESVSGTPNVNLPPADAVVIFGSPDATNSALTQAAGGGAPDSYLVAGTSRDDASFSGVDLAGEATLLGTTLLNPASADFDAAYEAALGEPAGAVPGIREAYDAVYLAALAAVAANSTGPAEVQGHLHYVANSPGQVATFGSEGFAEARAVLEANGDVNYIGASGQFDLTANGDIGKGQTEVWRIFGGEILGQEFRDVDLAAEIGADVPTGTLNRAVEPPGTSLRIGAVLDIASEGALQNAIQLALEEINASGGVFDSDVDLTVEDSGGDSAQAVSAAGALAGEGVSLIIGPASEAAAQTVADEFANPTSVPVLTLATSASLPINASEGFWRITPSPLLETPVLANLAIEAEIETVCVLYEANSGALAMANAFRAAFEHKAGGVRAVVEISDGVNLSACLGT
ncbi:MAG TPA: ABC transporter substrate-binding protein [Dehalococcoidia bacterium]|nr:ABC transporter substrate-binding protein [Dehalococcoidia bacterium]